MNPYIKTKSVPLEKVHSMLNTQLGAQEASGTRLIISFIKISNFTNRVKFAEIKVYIKFSFVIFANR